MRSHPDDETEVIWFGLNAVRANLGIGDTIPDERDTSPATSVTTMLSATSVYGVIHGSHPFPGLKGLLPQVRDDPLHFGNGVREIFLESPAKIIQARLAIGRADDPVLRTFTPAIREIGTLPAILRQSLVFGVTEFHLRPGKHLAVERAILDVAQTVLGIDIVVAGVNAAVIFHRHTFAAKLTIDADLRTQAHVLGHERLEMIDQDFAQIVFAPFVKDLAQEITPVFRIHRPDR